MVFKLKPHGLTTTTTTTTTTESIGATNRKTLEGGVGFVFVDYCSFPSLGDGSVGRRDVGRVNGILLLLLLILLLLLLLILLILQLQLLGRHVAQEVERVVL